MKLSYSRRRSGQTVPAALLLVCVFVVAAVAQNQGGKANAQPGHQAAPYWAYCANPPADASHAPAKPVDDTPQHVPDSTAAFTLAQIGDLFSVPDWHSGSSRHA